MPKHGWRWVQAIAGAIILFFLVRQFRADWAKLAEQPLVLEIRWGMVTASLIVTWAMYAVLIWGWRTVLHGWREWIRAVDAARIWTISSLGKYIPGKVWAIAGMAVMAEQRGVSGAAAMGSAIVMQLIALATGAMVALALTGTTLLERVPFGSTGAIVLAAGALVTAVALTSPSLTRRIGFWAGRPNAVKAVEPEALAGALFANLFAWCGYGLALQLLLHGILPDAQLSWRMATGAFAASYLVGYLALFLPGGLGVRELILVALLQDAIGQGPAFALAVASRLTLTVNELGAAIPFLLTRRPKESLADG